MASNLKLFIYLLVFFLVCASNGSSRKMVGIYELKKGDFSVKVTNWGATIISVVVPDSKGNLADVVLGYDSIAEYVNNTAYFGALVGRVINRISGARFVLNGTAYRLYANDGKNSLHGGHRGFSHVIWTVQEQSNGKFPYITFYYHSFDGEQGFPGDLDVLVTYKISGKYKLDVIMQATPRNKATPVNLGQHTYWNLGGEGSGDILSNSVQIFSSKMTPLDKNLIPTGEITTVEGTPYDFRKPMTVGSRIKETNGGYNINYVLDSPTEDQGMRKAAVVKDSKTGRVLELWTNQPGVQFYTSNYLNVKGKGGHMYNQYGALCLETQGFPDAVNHPTFPTTIVNPGQVYRHYMAHKFSFQ
ncbi:aldose 1-epimerase protein [Dioscorea alata]|uniref:Aldose 1-epimerase protein n=1 Tax=Dioscorea alata TaxID=55571 RepID=A0ACB7TX52_DIOAL|nr:aldose 1-epimerase protein [Dioscorea alata]